MPYSALRTRVYLRNMRKRSFVVSKTGNVSRAIFKLSPVPVIFFPGSRAFPRKDKM